MLVGKQESENFFLNLCNIKLQHNLQALRMLHSTDTLHKLKKVSVIIHNLWIPLLMECYLQMSLCNILVPLLSRHFIYDQEQEGEAPIDSNLLHEAILAIGKICKVLPWSDYYTLLSKYLKDIPRNEKLQHTLVKLLCTILNNFHFVTPITKQAATDTQIQVEQEEDKMETEIETDSTKPNAVRFSFVFPSVKVCPVAEALHTYRLKR